MEEEKKQQLMRTKELYNQGVKIDKIVEILGISSSTVGNNIKFLKDSGEIENRVHRRRNRVKEVYNQGKTTVKEISRVLVNISASDIKRDIAFLLKNGQIGEVPKQEMTEQERIDKEKRNFNQVKELYEQGKSEEEIAIELRENKSVIAIYVRRIKVKELYGQNRSSKEIAIILKVDEIMISKDLKYLRKIGEVKRKASIEERDKEIKRMYEDGKSVKEISQILTEQNLGIGTSITTIRNVIFNIEKYEKIERKQIEELYYVQGKRQDEIVEQLGSYQAKISRELEKIKEKRLKQPRVYMIGYRTKFEKEELKLTEIEGIKELVIVTKDWQDIVFYIRVCIRFHQFTEAMQFINSQMSRVNLTEEEGRNLEKLKNEIKILEQKFKEIKYAMGKKERMTQELKQVEIIEVKQESRKLEENDEKEQQIS